jgi:hypothetical protein
LKKMCITFLDFLNKKNKIFRLKYLTLKKF